MTKRPEAPDLQGLREDVVAVARRLASLGLTHGTSGNVSVRAGDGMLITPSAVPYDALQAEDVVHAALDGTILAAVAGRTPSSEWRMHAGILRARPDFDAVVHAHSPWATAVSCARRDIPPFHYMVAVAGGTDIRCARYATYGTAELGAAAVEALRDRRACLLANHGMVACAGTLSAALALAGEIEVLAAQFGRCLALGDPVLLDAAEMRRVLAAFATYR